MQFDVTPLDNGKFIAESCRGENELEIKVNQINNIVHKLVLFYCIDRVHGER
jgi:hypothetical protein